MHMIANGVQCNVPVAQVHIQQSNYKHTSATWSYGHLPSSAHSPSVLLHFIYHSKLPCTSQPNSFCLWCSFAASCGVIFPFAILSLGGTPFSAVYSLPASDQTWRSRRCCSRTQSSSLHQSMHPVSSWAHYLGRDGTYEELQSWYPRQADSNHPSSSPYQSVW